MPITLFDRLSLDDGAKARRTQDGYLVANPRVARTGIQEYRGSEVGKPELDVVRVYRPESSVFDRAAFASIAHRPITLQHPTDNVTASNWRDVAVGHSEGEVVRDGQAIRVPLMVCDGAAVKAVEDGTAEISLGYGAEIQWKSGKTKDGQAYDAIMTQIRANHIALVDAARGGPELRIGDATEPYVQQDGAKWCVYSADGTKLGEYDTKAEAQAHLKGMARKGENLNKDAKGATMRTILVDGIQCNVADDTQAGIIERHIKQLGDSLASTVEKLTKLQADSAAAATTAVTDKNALQAVHDTLKAENVTLKKQIEDASSPAVLDGLVKDRHGVVTKATAIMATLTGKGPLVIDGKSTDEIRKQIVTAVLGDAAITGWDAKMITASFNTLATPAAGTVAADGTGVRDALSAASVGGGLASNGRAAVDAIYDERNKALENAWRGTPPAAAH